MSDNHQLQGKTGASSHGRGGRSISGAGSALAPQHNHIVDVDFGDILLFAGCRFVGTVNEFSLDGHLIALFEVFAGDLSKFSPYHDVMPLGILDFLTLLVLVVVGGGDRKGGTLPALIGGSDFGIFSQAADKLDAVSQVVHDGYIFLIIHTVFSASHQAYRD